MIHYFNEDTRFIPANKRLISRWLKEIASRNGQKIGELNYIFCSDSYLLDINRQYLGHDYYTDIITFDNRDEYTGNSKISGDIFISIDTIEANASEYGEGFDRELHRVIAHGLLHLVGFDDTDDKLQKEMTAQENAALELFNRMIDE